ncbi:MAG: electron transport complex protein RnfA [bacterium]
MDMKIFYIFFASIFAHNIALTYFLGMCPFMAVSGKIRTAWGMGMAVTFVMTLAAAINWPINYFLLVPFRVEYLQYIAFIVVIAAVVQIVEIVVEKFFPTLYITMGIFLPLITVNCAILGVPLFMILREYSYPVSIAFAVGSGLGWTVAIVAMASIRQKLRFGNVPKPLQGPGITMIIAGIMAFAFMGFSGMVGIK